LRIGEAASGGSATAISYRHPEEGVVERASFAPADDSEISWRKPGANWPALPAGQVHLWRIDLDPDMAALASLESALSANERARAASFGRPDLRRRYVAGRGALRQILGGYLGLAPADLRFVYGEQGKPRLAESTSDPASLSEFSPPAADLRFNLAHCGDQALVAVALGMEVGVDLERLRPVRKARALAARYFTPEEQAGLDAAARRSHAGGAAAGEQPRSGREAHAGPGLASDSQVPTIPLFEAAFLQLWCCKEAYLKATGEALSRPLGSFGVEMGSGPSPLPRVLQVDGDVAMAERWFLAPIDGIEGHVAAVVTRGRPAAQARWRLEPSGLRARHPDPESST
jgi:4'-phosphopantetheinyl transferase